MKKIKLISSVMSTLSIAGITTPLITSCGNKFQAGLKYNPLIPFSKSRCINDFDFFKKFGLDIEKLIPTFNIEMDPIEITKDITIPAQNISSSYEVKDIEIQGVPKFSATVGFNASTHEEELLKLSGSFTGPFEEHFSFGRASLSLDNSSKYKMTLPLDKDGNLIKFKETESGSEYFNYIDFFKIKLTPSKGYEDQEKMLESVIPLTWNNIKDMLDYYVDPITKIEGKIEPEVNLTLEGRATVEATYDPDTISPISKDINIDLSEIKPVVPTIDPIAFPETELPSIRRTVYDKLYEVVSQAQRDYGSVIYSYNPKNRILLIPFICTTYSSYDAIHEQYDNLLQDINEISDFDKRKIDVNIEPGDIEIEPTIPNLEVQATITENDSGIYVSTTGIDELKGKFLDYLEHEIEPFLNFTKPASIPDGQDEIELHFDLELTYDATKEGNRYHLYDAEGNEINPASWGNKVVFGPLKDLTMRIKRYTPEPTPEVK